MTAIFIVFLLIIAGAFFDMLNKSVYVADAERRAIEKLKEIQRNTHHDFTDSEFMVIAIVVEVNINDEKSLSVRIINWFVESVMKI